MANAYLGDNAVDACFLGDSAVDASFLADSAVCEPPAPITGDIVLSWTGDSWGSSSPIFAGGGTMEASIDGGSTFNPILSGDFFPNGAGPCMLVGTGTFTSFRMDGSAMDGAATFTGGAALTTADNMFQGTTRYSSMDLSGFLCDNVTSFKEAFKDCSDIASIVMPTAMQNVTDLSFMFFHATSLASIDLSTIGTTSLLTTVENMFLDTPLLATISGLTFNTSGVTNFHGFISTVGVTSLDLSGIDMSSATQIEQLAASNTNLVSIIMPAEIGGGSLNDAQALFLNNTAMESVVMGNLNMSAAASSNLLDNMFYNCQSLICVSKFNTSTSDGKVDMFFNTPALVQPDAAAQADLADIDGANWVNANPCP